MKNGICHASACCDKDAYFFGGGSTNTGGVDGESFGNAGLDVRVSEASLESRSLLIEFNLSGAAFDRRQVYDEINLRTLGGPADLDGSGLVDNADIQARLVDADVANGTSLGPGDTNLNGIPAQRCRSH